MNNSALQFVRAACVATGLAAMLIGSATSQDLSEAKGSETNSDAQTVGTCPDCCCESCSCWGRNLLESVFCRPAPPLGEPWRLFEGCHLLERGRIMIGGHIQQGVTLNSRNPSNPPNSTTATTGIGNRPAGGYAYRANDYMLNQLWLTIERPTDTSQRGWDVGAHVDVLYGTDYLLFQMRGLETNGDFSNRWNGNSGSGLSSSLSNPDGLPVMGLALPQLYAEVACHDLTIRLGRFFLPLGYERPLVTQNNYYSYTYSAFFNPEYPFVTGAMAQWQVNRELVIVGGFHRGLINWEDNNNDLNVTAGFQWTAPNERMFVNYVFDYGRDDVFFGESCQYIHAIVAKFKLNDRWGYTVTSTYGHVSGLPLTPLGLAPPAEVNYDWYSVVQYLDYKINDRWATGMRFEWFDDKSGRRIFPNPLDLATRRPGVWYGLTFGVNYRHSANLVVRPEIRWDWLDAAPGAPAGPFGNGTVRDQFVASCDVILNF